MTYEEWESTVLKDWKIKIENLKKEYITSKKILILTFVLFLITMLFLIASISLWIIKEPGFSIYNKWMWITLLAIITIIPFIIFRIFSKHFRIFIIYQIIVNNNMLVSLGQHYSWKNKIAMVEYQKPVWEGQFPNNPNYN